MGCIPPSRAQAAWIHYKSNTFLSTLVCAVRIDKQCKLITCAPRLGTCPLLRKSEQVPGNEQWSAEPFEFTPPTSTVKDLRSVYHVICRFVKRINYFRENALKQANHCTVSHYIDWPILWLLYLRVVLCATELTPKTCVEDIFHDHRQRLTCYFSSNRIHASVELRCPPNYYGTQCETFCDSSLISCANGFYTCNADGTRSCAAGWSGTNCATHDGSTCPSGTLFKLHKTIKQLFTTQIKSRSTKMSLQKYFRGVSCRIN